MLLLHLDHQRHRYRYHQVRSFPPSLLPSFPPSQSFALTLIHLETDHRTSEDQLLLLLNRQLHGVNSSLIVCKWPVILTSCFFVTLLSWDMAGDQGGWFHALWVPIAGVAMAVLIWVWDRVLISGRIANQDWSRHFSFASLCSSLLPNNRHLEPTTAAPSTLEIVRSSLHQPSPAKVVDEEEQFAF
jgi:hypothetical protein